MQRYKVKLTILIMGRSCSSCKQEYETTVQAQSAEDAVRQAKGRSKADPTVNKFLVNYVRAIS